MKKILFASLFLISSFAVLSQTYTMSNSSVSTCSGTFYDSGGSGSNYANNENYVFTICPGTAGNMVQVAFTAFTTQATNDVLTIYDGSTTGATVIGTYSGTTSPGTVLATNAAGCLTFKFVSNNSNNNNGWTATISCLSPPPNDNCSGATTVTQEPDGSCTTITSTVANATNSGIASCTGTADDDVWFVFTATATQAIINRTTTGSWDSGVEIFASTGAAPGSCIGASLGCQDAESSFTVSGLTVGMHYYVRVYSWSSGFTPSPATFTFCITTPPTPPAGSVIMAAGSTTACSGNFYDPGGLANYSDSYGPVVMTICPSTAGAKLKLVFSAFQTESTSLDYLEIFDGNSTGAPSLGTFGGTTSPGTIIASASNASGCLTFRFRSDGSVNYAGWVAAMSCVIPCQTITANWVSSNEAPEADGVIRICQGQSVNFVGSGTFGTSGAGATYAWNMGNGTTVSGANMNYAYPAAGSYLANLVITDPSGCTNTNALNRVVEVSTTPTITTSASPSTLCTNQTSALSASVTMTPFTVNCTPPVSGTTFLPDGSGASYSTAITVNCYSPTSTITAVTDITSICLNMEHSYSGDLSMTLVCPNGQSANLITYPSGTGSANLGTPWATATVDGSSTTTTPGVGANYCFSSTASTAWASAPVTGGTFTSGNGPGTYTDSYIPAGTYLPMQTLSGLIGCPLNGAWTINVTDNLASDNGYIFNWDINFNATIFTAPSFTPTIASQGWVPAATLTSTGATTANVVPVSQGTPCFTYSVTDNFGCTYTSPQCITVNCGTSLPVGLLNFEASAISNERVELVWNTSSETNSSYFLIERSIDGKNWEMIAEVPAAGNSNTEKHYSALDAQPYMGTSYYRLLQYDTDGTLGTTDMEAIYLIAGDDEELVVFPNPSSSLVSIKGDLVALSTFEVLNSLGQNVRSQIKFFAQADGSLVMDISGLANGIYTIKNGSKVKSLVKE